MVSTTVLSCLLNSVKIFKYAIVIFYFLLDIMLNVKISEMLPIFMDSSSTGIESDYENISSVIKLHCIVRSSQQASAFVVILTNLFSKMLGF